LEILEYLNKMDEATLTPYAYKYYFPKPRDNLSLYQLDILYRIGKYLSDLEIKYFQFIKPKLRISLMEVQTYLESFYADFDLVKRFEDSKDVVEKTMPKSILGIMKEIYKIHKMGIKLKSRLDKKKVREKGSVNTNIGQYN